MLTFQDSNFQLLVTLHLARQAWKDELWIQMKVANRGGHMCGPYNGRIVWTVNTEETRNRTQEETELSLLEL